MERFWAHNRALYINSNTHETHTPNCYCLMKIQNWSDDSLAFTPNSIHPKTCEFRICVSVENLKFNCFNKLNFRLKTNVNRKCLNTNALACFLVLSIWIRMNRFATLSLSLKCFMVFVFILRLLFFCFKSHNWTSENQIAILCAFVIVKSVKRRIECVWESDVYSIARVIEFDIYFTLTYTKFNYKRILREHFYSFSLSIFICFFFFPISIIHGAWTMVLLFGALFVLSHTI